MSDPAPSASAAGARRVPADAGAGGGHRAGGRLPAADRGHEQHDLVGFQARVMNGTDPSAQDVAVQKSLFTEHEVKIFLNNQQVTDSLTESYINLAHANGIPVVGVYETMPTPGYDYQSWMLAEVHAWTRPWPTRPPPSTCEARAEAGKGPTPATAA